MDIYLNTQILSNIYKHINSLRYTNISVKSQYINIELHTIIKTITHNHTYHTQSNINSHTVAYTITFTKSWTIIHYNIKQTKIHTYTNKYKKTIQIQN